MKRILIVLAFAAALCSCRHYAVTETGVVPSIWPDYVGVTVPDGLSSFDFRMADGRKCSWTSVRQGDTLFFSVSVKDKAARVEYRYEPFPVYISQDPIDPFIAYRLIEPNYESWREMGLYVRELASFRERPLVTNAATGDGCVNCHTFSPADQDCFLFHARGAGGGTVFADHGSVRILNLATVGPHKQGTYPAWHPDGRYVAFSSNSTFQSFPVAGTQEIEVYDKASDIILFDTATDSVSVAPAMNGTEAMETFPSWSPDGSTLYFCRADSVTDVAAQRAQVHYALMAVPFKDGSFEGEPSVVWESDSVSISFPRVNGKWMLVTASAYATFPIWHKEADLWLLDLETGEMRPADEINSDDTESYHSWSSSGRWVVFSSRRGDGRYTRLYIAHFDGEGHFSKPFLLPQKNASYNDWRLKSYNIPEFVRHDPGRFDARVSKLFK